VVNVQPNERLATYLNPQHLLHIQRYTLASTLVHMMELVHSICPRLGDSSMTPDLPSNGLQRGGLVAGKLELAMAVSIHSDLRRSSFEDFVIATLLFATCIYRFCCISMGKVLQ
jgi:hypothetical protein